MNENDAYIEATQTALEKAVAEALERKRRLGQYAVVWRNGGPVFIGPNPPPGHRGIDSPADSEKPAEAGSQSVRALNS